MSDLAPLLFAGFALYRFMSVAKVIDSSAPRGIRNNNPLNIRATREVWKGQSGVDDGGFVIFESPAYGVRAAARILNTYRARGVVSLGEIVRTWAPAIENDTNAYIAHMEQILGMRSGDPIKQDDYPYLLAGMITHENGQNPYSFMEIYQGVKLA